MKNIHFFKIGRIGQGCQLPGRLYTAHCRYHWSEMWAPGISTVTVFILQLCSVCLGTTQTDTTQSHYEKLNTCISITCVTCTVDLSHQLISWDYYYNWLSLITMDYHLLSFIIYCLLLIIFVYHWLSENLKRVNHSLTYWQLEMKRC